MSGGSGGPSGPGDMNRGGGVLNSTANSSGPSIGASSLVTDANSALSGGVGGPHLQRSASINTDPYMRLPASPMSFSSNNISGSSVMDGSSIVQQSPHHEQLQNQGASSVTSNPKDMHAHKKQRVMEVKQEDILQQQVMQKLLQRQQDPLQMQGIQNPQLHSMISQHRLAQRQLQQPQMFPQMQCSPIAQQQMRQQLLPHIMQSVSPVKRPVNGGICARRIMQYLYHQRHRPQDNKMSYWRKFVEEYFAPRGRKRWCLSLYDNMGNQALGAFPQTSVDAWHCGICGSRSGKGFEATCETLPRLFQIKFDHDVIDEHLFLDMPNEYMLSGLLVLEYAKAVQESIHEHLHVVREGQLRITFTPELKILSWEFCVRRHEEFLSRRFIAPQVNQLLQVSQKYQNAVKDSGSAGISPQDLQASCNMFVAAGRQLAKSLELQSLNDLGFSKRYVRCLQIAEVVNGMKDLIDFGQEHKIGPIARHLGGIEVSRIILSSANESLKSYTAQAAAKLQAQKLQAAEQLRTPNGLSADPSTLSKLMSIHHHPGMCAHIINGNLTNTQLNSNNNTLERTAMMNNSYQNLLRNSMSKNQNLLHQELPNGFNGPINQSQPVSHYRTSVSPVLSNNLFGQFPQQPPMNSGNLPQNNNNMQQQVIQQMLQDGMNKNRPEMQQPPATSVHNNNGPVNAGPAKSTTESGNAPSNISNSAVGAGPTRSNSFKSAPTETAVAGSSVSSRLELPQNVDLAELDQIVREFGEGGMFSGDIADFGFDWKV
ncbi:probable transcriptional regulator SLK3 isoform X1 [Ananas comosus]|uniref:Probable transcriptional regulator SLK3 isoform X1 n=1 Tax=Ananas comosus TaxID=4615 RepID=A0A6P5H135_ANACO|nr:probable transcriptional regulator SLK3 isoform X1 [Ananas comosus]XP_020114637.1 probable transcriptional regulator SLK3 isoform X1 [Ananas comosus]